MTQDGYALRHASAAFKADHEIVVVAIRQSPRALMHASLELQVSYRAMKDELTMARLQASALNAERGRLRMGAGGGLFSSTGSAAEANAEANEDSSLSSCGLGGPGCSVS